MVRRLIVKSGAVALLTVVMACGTTPEAEEVAEEIISERPAAGTDCEMVEVSFALTGSEFIIEGTPLGAGDAVSSVGPGTAVLRFTTDSGGEIIDGPVSLVSYNLAMEFNVADVQTDMDVEAVAADGCGVATGSYASGTLGWSTPVTGYHSSGTITCNAFEFVCVLAELPKGEPQNRDTTIEQAFNSFVFDQDVRTFEMARVEIPNDDAGKTYLKLVGKESSRAVCGKVPACSN